MKALPWKKIGIGVAAVALFVIAIFYFKGAGSAGQAPSYVNPAFGEYISSYSAGVLSSRSPIRVMLTKDVVDSALIGQESSVKLFSFSPSLRGKTVWLDRRSVEFKPDEPMMAGQVYAVNFNVGRLIDVPTGFDAFEYTFQVMAQNYEVVIDNMKAYVKTDLKRQKVEGMLNTADYAENDNVEQTLAASQDGNDLKVTWTHSGDGKQHAFIVEDVNRKDKASTVKVAVNGDAIGVERATEETVEVPSLGDFKLMQTKVVQNPTQYVVLQFSDPLKEKQNLNGLIRMDGAGSLTYEIHDNEIWIYPSVRQAGTKQIYIEPGIRNILDYKMETATSSEVVFEQVKPGVRFTGKGTILPSTSGMVLPFEAVSLKSVDVSITKIFENNILQFLQVNRLDGNYEMHRVGRRVLKKMLTLDNMGVTDLGKWNRFTLDLNQLIAAEPGAIYQVKLSFKRSYSVYACDGESGVEYEAEEEDEFEQYYDEGYYEEDDYYYYEDYDWNERDNPCNGSYYTRNRNVFKNILASDIGLISKRGSDGTTTVIATDLKTAQPLAGVQVALYDFQQQVLASGATGTDGKLVAKTEAPPYVVTATNGTQRGYLRLQDGEALSVAHFDVSGEAVQKGLKGFLYGERGVWRPGDSLYLTFVLEDKNKVLPPAHPVVFELQNPQGQVTSRIVRSTSENGFYNFATATSAEAPTGNWLGRVKVGGTEFSQTVKIETVKPNRLKINLDFGTERFTSPSVQGKLDVKWLHGAPARNLKAEFNVLLASVPTRFNKYDDFVFDDPARDFQSETLEVYSGYTDGEGKAVVNAELTTSNAAPGFLNAVFRGKVFEESGNFSIDNFSIPYSPYASYVGLRTGKGERYSGILYLDTLQRVDVVSLDGDGKPVSRNGVQMTLHKLDRRWWWDNSYNDIANYVEGSYSNAVAKGTINTSNGKGSWTFEAKSPDWGRYFVRACDPVSGHCTGKVIYMDDKGWYSRYRGEEGQGAASMLSFSTDKQSYNIGEKVKLSIPGSAQGKALVSIENGSKVIQTYWVDTQAGENPFSFDVTTDMTPNAFVHVTLLQRHDQTTNDRPIRLYGIMPFRVENPATHLEPVLTIADVLEPGEEVVIKVSEKTKRKMTYTVAVVDEGLLDLTRFKTPDPWNRFYAGEALGVRTWDLYDQVMGAFGARLERLLAVGGDAEMRAGEEDARANRFKPVVKFFGPFTLDGGTATHKFIMPQYVGSVRTMVVAGYEGAYGKTDKATPVRKPLMVLATLPRVLGPEEIVKLPVTLFASEKNIKQAKVEVKVSGPVSLAQSSKTVTFAGIGDLTTDFELSVKPQTGVAKVEVTATSGSYKATDIIEIEIRNPNTPVTKVIDQLLEPGKAWDADLAPFGILGTNTAVLEVSNIPPINLGSRIRYLFNYPYGCVEQTTSSVFPQLYLDYVKVLTDNEKAAVQRNVTAGIERLKQFVRGDGGFSYWPGNTTSDPWGSTYAGHFLIEAKAKGYYVPADMIKGWQKFQRAKAQEWRREDEYYNTTLMQAYRLYALALSGSPELGAMNRLREMSLSSTAAWMLAAAYAKSGQTEAAKKLIANLDLTVKPYREMGYTYGSDVRDKALIIETLVLLNEKTKAFELVKELSERLSSYYWMSTQEVAFSLKAIAAFVGLDKKGDLKFKYTINGKTVTASSELPISQVTVANADAKQTIKVVSESKGTLFARVIMEGTPVRGQEDDAENNLRVTVNYTDTNGVPIDPTRLEQGTEFVAQVTVSHPGVRSGYQNMALAQVFPSGWEINNLRLTDDTQGFLTMDAFTYQDIRDDRVYTYFDLWRNTAKTYKVLLTASYAGKFYLPAVSCEAMYDNSIYGRKKGMEVEVVKPVVQ